MDTDEFSGIFDELDPDDFAGLFSTDVETPNVGEDAFTEFVDRNLDSTRFAFLASDGEINPVAVLTNPTTSWLHTPEDHESLGDYLERLSNEARRVEATWFFFVRKTKVGVGEDSTDNMFDPETLKKAKKAGQLTDGVFFYAARHEGVETESRRGIMRAHGNRLGELIEGTPDQEVPVFDEILE